MVVSTCTSRRRSGDNRSAESAYMILNYQHDGEVDSHDGLEEERFEEVCHVADDDQKCGGNVHGENGAKQASPKEDLFDINRMVWARARENS